jgi:hypothetical protein
MSFRNLAETHTQEAETPERIMNEPNKPKNQEKNGASKEK